MLDSIPCGKRIDIKPRTRFSVAEVFGRMGIGPIGVKGWSLPSLLLFFFAIIKIKKISGFGNRRMCYLYIYGGITYQFRRACLGGLQERAWQGLVIIEKRRVRREWAARGTKLQTEHSPPDFGGAAPFIALSKDLVDNFFVDSQINCQIRPNEGR